MDAERLIAAANPPLEKGDGVRHTDTTFTRATLSKIRSAHVGLDDEEYAAIRQRSLDDEEPLTRSALTKEAQQARLQKQPLYPQNGKPSTILTVMPYIGGKSPYGASGANGLWVMSMLPYEPDGLWIESHCGMASQTLNRPRSRFEILNDLNNRIVNFFACIRRWPAEFDALANATPYAESEYYDAYDLLDYGPPLDRAIRFALAVALSPMSSDSKKHYMVTKQGYAGQQRNRWPRPRRIAEISDRLSGIQLTCQDAAKLLRRVAHCDHAIIYMDPPYPSADQTLYAHQRTDTAALTAAVLAQSGRVAISGQNDEWDHLIQHGWHRYERDAHLAVPSSSGSANPTRRRTDVLWTSYETTPRRLS